MTFSISEGMFVEDFFEDGMLHVITLRSTVKRGKIVSVKIPEEIPESVTVIGAKDIPGNNSIEVFGRTMPVLASDFVRYTGEPVLLLAGPVEKTLHEIIDNIEVSYEEETPWTSIKNYSKEQVAEERIIVKGNPEQAMVDAFQIIEGEYTTDTQVNRTIDPHGAFTLYHGKILKVISPTQWPFHVKSTVAGVLGISPRSISVHVPEMSPSLEGKLWYPSLLAAHAALISYKTGKPAKIILRYEENILFTPSGASVYISNKTGINKEGNPVVMDISITADTGAYPILARELLDRVCIASAGVYACKNMRVQGKIILTNTPPAGSYSGLGLAQGFFSIETHTSRISELSQIDTYNWKRANIIRKGRHTVTGDPVVTEVPLEELLSRVVVNSDFQRKRAAYELLRKRRNGIEESPIPYRGIGLATAFQGNSFIGKGEEGATYSVRLRLDKDGSLTIFNSGVSEDGKAAAIWKNTAGEILGIKNENIKLEIAGTEGIPNTGPSTLSRNITIIRKLIERCSQAVKKQRFRHPLPIELSRNIHLPRPIEWKPGIFNGKIFPPLSWVATVVEVEFNATTLEVEVRGIWLCIDAGKILDQKSARKRIEAEVLYALEWASSALEADDILYSEKILSVPPIYIEFFSKSKRNQPGGIEELAMSSVPSALISAISQATGYFLDSIPFSPQSIQRLMEEQ
ncbi:MAG: hypothetical protein DRP87_02945 [Spirochaetes bacterium]|nr:MAG: hypothetical protein DRP87_02945 [Spirochaetota bacterium]